jgi:hypothetical protein
VIGVIEDVAWDSGEVFGCEVCLGDEMDVNIVIK